MTPMLRRALPLSFALACGFAQAGGLTIEVHAAPSVLPTPAGRALVYELSARNFGADCARIVDVRASGDGQPLRRLQATMIAPNALVYDARMTPLPNPAAGESSPHPVDVPARGGAVIYFFLTLDDNLPLPQTLHHEVDTTACAANATTRDTASSDSPVSRAAPVVVGLPFRGTGWVAGDSPNDFGTHRRTLIPVRDANGDPIVGEFHAPERYAIDWVKVDADAHRAIGPLNQNSSYLAWGQQIVAVADGTISRTRDGMPEGTPPHNPPNPTVETAGGNYVMQDIGGGHYAFYAHLQPGSLRVKEGDRVVRGQVLALLGDSGNSSEAHLHFHVSDANDPLMSEGVPYVFDRYTLTGLANAFDEDNGLFDDMTMQAPSPKFWLMPASYAVLDADSTATPPAAWAFPMRWPAQ